MSVKRQLFEAVETNNFERVKFFIEKANVSVSIVNSSHQNLAHIAAKCNNVDILKYVLDKDASTLDQIDQFNNSPLHFAAVKGAFEAVKYLVEEHNADITVLGGRDKDRTAFHVAVEFNHMKIVKYFVEERKVNFNVPHVNQTQPPIFLAIKSKRWNMIEYLIEEKNADLLILNARNETILFPIVRQGNVPFLKYLLDEKRVRLDVNAKNEWGETILHVAAHMNRIYLLKYLVNKKHVDVNIQKDSDHRTALHYAAARDRYVICKFLVERGAKVHLKDDSGLTAVELAKDENLIEYLEGVSHSNTRSRRNVETFLSPLHAASLPSDYNTHKGILRGLHRTVECVGENDMSDYVTESHSHLQSFLMLATLAMKNLMQTERETGSNNIMRYLSPAHVLRNRMSSVAIDVIDETLNFRS